jgi:hypothetical protein
MHVERTVTYHNSMYNRLPEDELSDSKDAVDIRKG